MTLDSIPSAVWVAIFGALSAVATWIVNRRSVVLKDESTAMGVTGQKLDALDASMGRVEELTLRLIEARKDTLLIPDLQASIDELREHTAKCEEDTAKLLFANKVLQGQVNELQEDVHSKQRDVVKLQTELDTVQLERVKEAEAWDQRSTLVDSREKQMTKEQDELRMLLGTVGLELAAEKEWRLNHCKTEHGGTR